MPRGTKKEPKPPEAPIPTMYGAINDFAIDTKVEELRKLIATIEARIAELLAKKRGLKTDEDLIGHPLPPL